MSVGILTRVVCAGRDCTCLCCCSVVLCCVLGRWKMCPRWNTNTWRRRGNDKRAGRRYFRAFYQRLEMGLTNNTPGCGPTVAAAHESFEYGPQSYVISPVCEPWWCANRERWSQLARKLSCQRSGKIRFGHRRRGTHKVKPPPQGWAIAEGSMYTCSSSNRGVGGVATSREGGSGCGREAWVEGVCQPVRSQVEHTDAI